MKNAKENAITSTATETVVKSNGNSVKKPTAVTIKKTVVGKTTNGQQKAAPKNGNAKGQDMTARLKVLETELAKARSAAEESFKQANISKEELQQVQKENRTKRPISVQEAIAKVLETKAISDKLEFLQETRKKLAGFSFSNSGVTSSIELKDASGKSFRSSNSGTVQLVIDTMKQELDKHIGKAEEELLEII
jgi:hypothetical protein